MDEGLHVSGGEKEKKGGGVLREEQTEAERSGSQNESVARAMYLEEMECISQIGRAHV